MSIKKEKIPIVRFKDFSEPWIKNQLSEVAEFSKGRGYSKKDLQSHGTPIILYGRLYTSYESVISNVETYANLEENSVVSEGGEVIIPASGESADDISRASCVIDRGIILGGDLNIVRPHEYLNSLFIAITLSNGSQQRELSKRAQGKSVVHLHNSDLKAVKLFYPSYEEQSAIGSLFSTLDDLLASYKDNLTNYQSLKATMLSKMFPKAGQTVPEIRLDGFTGEWKFSSIGEQDDITKLAGFEFTKHVVYSDEGEIPAIRGLNVKNQKINLSDVKYIDRSDFSKLNRSKLIENDLLFTYVGTVGEVARVPENVLWYLAPNVSRIRLNRTLDSRFVLYQMTSNRFKQKQISPLIATSSQPALSMANIRKFIISFTTLPEQQAIGSYFSNLDNLIAAHQEKISQLETLKKKLLQDMFI